MYIFLSILLPSLNYLAMLNSFQFLFTSLPRKWAEGYWGKYMNTTSGALYTGYIFLFLSFWDCLLFTVQDVNTLHAAGDHTFDLSRSTRVPKWNHSYHWLFWFRTTIYMCVRISVHSSKTIVICTILSQISKLPNVDSPFLNLYSLSEETFIPTILQSRKVWVLCKSIPEG